MNKNFEEWFTTTYGELYKGTALQGALKEIAFKAWEAAIEYEQVRLNLINVPSNVQR